MALPKRKMSTCRRDRRRSHWKIAARAATRCPHCGAMMQTHRACAGCGQYQGHQVLKAKEKRRS
jgi:large subunit ribosomal protein L32